MTKTLTEQWREGELHFGFYYVKFPNEEPQIYSSEYLKSFTVVKDAEKIDILAPVPDYMDYNRLMRDSVELDKAKKIIYELVSKNEQLEKKLEIATKALKEYADRTNWIEGNFMCVYNGECFADEESAEQALKKMEGVK